MWVSNVTFKVRQSLPYLISMLTTDPLTFPLSCTPTVTLPSGAQQTNQLMNETNKEALRRQRRAPFSSHFTVGWRSAPRSALYIHYQAVSGRHFVKKIDEGAVSEGTNLTWLGLKEGPLILMGCNGGRCASVWDKRWDSQSMRRSVWEFEKQHWNFHWLVFGAYFICKDRFTFFLKSVLKQYPQYGYKSLFWLIAMKCSLSLCDSSDVIRDKICKTHLNKVS